MVTPAIAGAMTTVIANTIFLQFELPAKWTALFVSLMFAAIVVFRMRRIPNWQKAFYLLFNALVVFTVAAGTNNLGEAAMNRRLTRVSDGPDGQQLAKFASGFQQETLAHSPSNVIRDHTWSAHEAESRFLKMVEEDQLENQFTNALTNHEAESRRGGWKKGNWIDLRTSNGLENFLNLISSNTPSKLDTNTIELLRSSLKKVLHSTNSPAFFFDPLGGPYPRVSWLGGISTNIMSAYPYQIHDFVLHIATHGSYAEPRRFFHAWW
jgi:hypothetical protein